MKNQETDFKIPLSKITLPEKMRYSNQDMINFSMINESYIAVERQKFVGYIDTLNMLENKLEVVDRALNDLERAADYGEEDEIYRQITRIRTLLYYERKT